MIDQRLSLFILVVLLAVAAACSGRNTPEVPAWESTNPIMPLPEPPLGIHSTFDDLPEPPKPERVRLGRWLFFDKRLSADGTIACASCHRPEYGFSEPTPVSTGVHGQRGRRKAPSFVNQAWTIYPNFFWDGRAASLEEQALGPLANALEMGVAHEEMVQIVSNIPGYRKYFGQAFGDDIVTTEHVVKALADYERTRMSGNSPWDKWRQNRDDSAVPDQVKQGHALFFGKAACNQCHLNQNFTDNRFHNIGVGWNPVTKTFADAGRYEVTNDKADMGAFKTPTLRDVSKRAPYMHDGSTQTLREAVEHYNKGGTNNPWLSPKISPLGLTQDEMAALVSFLEALDGDVPTETAPVAFPQ